MAQSAATPSGAAQDRARRGQAGTPAAGPWWRVSWSVPAAVRALRATIVIPALFALTFKVIRDEQMTYFAVFGGFGTLVMASFGGGLRDKAVAHFGLAVAGSVTLIIGTVVSGSAWMATIVTIPVGFAVFFAGSAGPNAAAGVTPCLLAYVLPVASAAPVSTIGSRLAGWWLASAVGTGAVLLLSSRPAGDKLRALTAALASELVGLIDAAIRAEPIGARREAAIAANGQLMDAFVATPYRPIGLAAPDQALANLIHQLQWCTTLAGDATDGHIDLAKADAANRALLAECAQALQQIAALVSGRDVAVDPEPIWAARQSARQAARQLHTPAGDPEIAARQAEYAFHACAIAVATSAALGEALITARRASPTDIARQRQGWLHGTGQVAPHPDGPARGHLPTWSGAARQAERFARADASLQSVWFRNSARGAAALAAAVLVARLVPVQHSFWVVLGTLSVLRTSAAATGSTALRGLAGTVVGFAVGAALLVGIGTNPVALWIVFPFAVLVAAYTPGTAPFAAGQAAFTILIVVLFNVIVPAGWTVGLLRVEDVGIGCAVSLIVGYLFWPRGVLSLVGDNLAQAFRSGSDYLHTAVSWALGDTPRRSEPGTAAFVTGFRLEDAMRGYLTEQGSKRLSKADLWTLTTGAMRLRLSAYSMASLPDPTVHGGGDDAMHGLQCQEAQLQAFYDGLATEVAKPDGARTAVPPPTQPDPATATAQAQGVSTRAPADNPDALWVGLHLDSLQAHATELTGPAERLAELRRRPWWR